MAGMKSSARDIPRPTGPDGLTVVGARSVPVTKMNPLPLTPPASISPNLPAHGTKPYGTRSATAQLSLDTVESDLDLHDNGERGGSAERGRDLGSPGLDTTGAITPALLAKHHLPEILLNHGPLAIRHIMGFLTSAVPGFSGIPPTKARRIVVSALESGGGKGGREEGGVKGSVKFEKVGWGRWDARLKGHAARNGSESQQSPPSSYSSGMPIAKNDGWTFDRTRLNAPGSSWTGDSAVFSHDDDMDISMPENEADKMSLDGSCSSSEVPSEDEIMDDDDPDDITDDEDWAALGAAALRADSYAASTLGKKSLSPNLYVGGTRGGGGPSLTTLAKSVPNRTVLPTNFDLSAYGVASDSQEREAIEALLRLGSV